MKVEEKGGRKTKTIDIDEDTDLRKAMKDAKIDVYTLKGKFKNCGGAGQCGMCMVSVEDGQYNVTPKGPKEEFMMRSRPGNWRLACRTRVNGDITVRTKPQA